MTLVISYYLVPLLAAALVVGVEPPSSPLLAAPPPPPATTPATLPGCPSTCGDVVIPYPFGIGDECALHTGFTVTCDQSFKPPRAYINGTASEVEGDISSILASGRTPRQHHEIIDVSLDAGEARIFAIHSSICYRSASASVSTGVAGVFDDPFLISSTRNVFTAIGCRGLAFLTGMPDERYYFTGCITSCESLEEAAQDKDQCSGLGCCQTSLPANLTIIEISFGNQTGTAKDSNDAWRFNPCSYAFIGEKNWYNFSRNDLIGNQFASRVAGDRTIPLVLDWAIRSKGSCRRTPEGTWRDPACVSANSACANVAQGGGYRCNCSTGYQGNAYLPGGCTDIDECALRRQFPKEYEKVYPCGPATTCRNIPGGYICPCKFGHVPATEGCRPIFPGYATAMLVTIFAIFVMALLIYFLRKEHQHRVRRGFFDKNGGEILKGMNIKTFTELELEKMTNHYSKLIGEGHFSKVFDGITTDNNQQVAVKCPKLDDSKKNQKNGGREFVDEITFQFKLSHRNLVRLVGCCLETSVPRLVFEFISKGSLYNVLHDASNPCSLSLTKRLDIAIGSAEAISYMHSHGDHIHGDIKSANILLDEDLLPKVSDFGSSKLLSINMYARAVAADRNYVDPVYMKTDRFTAKSDVYSFGVVLLELITRKTAKYNGNNSLPIDFIRTCKEEGNGIKMYDTDILMHDVDAQSSQVYIECLDKISELPVRCLNEVDVDQRPTMAEVVEELNKIKLMATEVPRPKTA